MKHIKTILGIATIAAIIVVGGTQNAQAECGYYSDATDCSQVAYPDVCTASKQLRDLNGMSSTSNHPFPLLLGFARQQQVEVTHPKFTCSQNNSVCNMEAGAPKCYVFDTQNGTMLVSNEQPTFVPASVKLSVGPVLNNDAEYTAESEALTQYKASAMAKIADGQPVIQNFDINAYTLPDTYTPPFIAQNAVYCKDHPQSDYCMIAMAIENNRLAINKIEGQYAMYAQDKSGKRFIKFNGDATKAEVALLITNLTALHVPLVIKSALSSCAIQMETPPPDAYDPLNFNPVGDVMKTLGTIKSDAYLQNMDYCLPFGEKSDFPKPQCAGSSNPSPVFNPSADNIQLTVAQGVADAKTTLGVEKYDKLQCALEVLKDFQVTVYTQSGTVPQPPVDQKLKDDGLKMAMCQSTIFDCEKMVKIGDGKAGSQDKMMMFLINGGKYNQVISVMDDGAFFMFDPMDLKKVFACKSGDAMLGMGRKEDGSSKYVVWIDSVNDKTRVRVVNGRPVALLKKVINDHGVSVEQQMQNDKNNIQQPPCDFSLYMKEAGLQDADVVAFPELPAGANNIADGVILDDKLVLLLQDKSDQTGVMKGIAVYDFSGATPALDYRALPGPYVDKPKSSDRMVARSLKDGVEVVMVKESDSTAVRCVSPTSGGITCGDSTINAASKSIVANLYDKARKGVKDNNFATQLLLMSQGESLDPMTALMANIDLSNATKLLKASLDNPDVDMKMKGDFIQAISGAIFHKIEGYGDIADVVNPTPGGTLLMRKAEGKMYPDIIDNFPAASSCLMANMDKMAGPDLLCIGSGMFYALPKTNEEPKHIRTDVKGTGTLVLEPLYKSQEGEDHTFLWTLEQKVGDQWVDKTAMLSDRAVERPTLSFPNQTATELGSVTGVKTGKSVGTGADAVNNEVYRSTVTITDPGGLKSVGVNTFSVSSTGQVSGITQLVGTSGETNPLGGAMQEVRPADVASSWYGALEGAGCSALPNAPSSNFFWILVIPAFMTRVMRAAYRRK